MLPEIQKKCINQKNLLSDSDSSMIQDSRSIKKYIKSYKMVLYIWKIDLLYKYTYLVA